MTVVARHTMFFREDPLIGETVGQVLADEGIEVLPRTHAHSVKPVSDKFMLETSAGTLRGDALLTATGHTPNVEALNPDLIGIRTGAHGAIEVDEYLRTSVPHVYVAGDCTNQPQLVYVAAAADAHAASNMMGHEATLDLRSMPAVVFTDPQTSPPVWVEGEVQAWLAERATRRKSSPDDALLVADGQ